MDMNKYQFYLKCIEIFQDSYREDGGITDEQWYSLINRVLDCVYKELENSNRPNSYYYGSPGSSESSWSSISSESSSS